MPKEAQVALNCDVRIVQFGKVVGYGGVIHNHAVRFIFGVKLSQEKVLSYMGDISLFLIASNLL